MSTLTTETRRLVLVDPDDWSFLDDLPESEEEEDELEDHPMYLAYTSRPRPTEEEVAELEAAIASAWRTE